MRIAHTDPNRYGQSTHVHGGAGTIRFLSLWNSDAFETPWLFVHRAELPPKTGIGYHAHDTCEEMFTILDNAARFMHNGNTAELNGPVAVPCRAGEAHGIYNHTNKPTQFMNFCVVSPGGSYDCRDFGENLVNAVPGPADKLPVDDSIGHCYIKHQACIMEKESWDSGAYGRQKILKLHGDSLTIFCFHPIVPSAIIGIIPLKNATSSSQVAVE